MHPTQGLLFLQRHTCKHRVTPLQTLSARSQPLCTVFKCSSSIRTSESLPQLENLGLEAYKKRPEATPTKPLSVTADEACERDRSLVLLAVALLEDDESIAIATMSSHSNSTSSSPPRVPPHIRLNSAQEDLLTNDNGPQSRSLINQRLGTSPLQGQLSNNHIYSSNQIQDSSERLLPPGRKQSMRPTRGRIPQSSHQLSRAILLEDQAGTRNGAETVVASTIPFRDSTSRPGSRADSDDDNVNTQTVSEKYNILPSSRAFALS